MSELDEENLNQIFLEEPALAEAQTARHAQGTTTPCSRLRHDHDWLRPLECRGAAWQLRTAVLTNHSINGDNALTLRADPQRIDLDFDNPPAQGRKLR